MQFLTSPFSISRWRLSPAKPRVLFHCWLCHLALGIFFSRGFSTVQCFAVDARLTIASWRDIVLRVFFFFFFRQCIRPHRTDNNENRTLTIPVATQNRWLLRSHWGSQRVKFHSKFFSGNQSHQFGMKFYIKVLRYLDRWIMAEISVSMGSCAMEKINLFCLITLTDWMNERTRESRYFSDYSFI